MTAFFFKLLAMSSMVIDHISSGFLNNNMMMRNIGCLAFITYAFLMAEAFYHLRKNPSAMKHHILKLLVLCLIAEMPFDYFEYGTWVYFQKQNVLPTLILGYISLILSEAWWWRWTGQAVRILGSIIRISGSVGICLLGGLAAQMIHSEYGFGGVFLIVMFFLYLRQADQMNLPIRMVFLELICFTYLAVYIWARSDFGDVTSVSNTLDWFKEYCPGIILSFLPLAFYNRELGYNQRWFSVLYSLFYPLQFVGLVIIRMYLNRF